ncbi:SDR family oxidoreductase [Qipengyuania sp. MTN3-11]|uniref:SDR family oxidoreductase n=1 Tax=Qipengyuania sp. MTN3-11 TaxID=3056557 RepID=UPI0036F43F53
MLRILVTGAAGLIGGEVCARLVAAGHRVTAIIHRHPVIRANDGKPVAVANVERGDVARSLFGWDAERFERVAKTHELLIHCAASVRFDLSDADYAAVNVGGTAHALALAEAGDMGFLHVGTAYVCGARSGTVTEQDPLPDAGFANGYEASKAAAERLVRTSKLRWAIARPSIVTGAHSDGAIRQFDTIYAAFKLIALGLVRHMPASAIATLDFVPIDHVAGGIVAIAERMEEAAGKTCHLVSGNPLPVADFAGCIAAYPQFRTPELVDPERFDPSGLPARERRLYRRTAGLYAAYFQRDPRFDDSTSRAITGCACPPTGPTYVRRLIDYCIREGFLPAA